ncbi:putative cyclic AMP-dependent transcription factor ATF-6 alpha [Scophthalmus maximus]|uniref:Activating transcription factor 6 n=1 Tax=Scophthalmus maximus TaxID=52904 RepID=A0A2U9C4N8_SCOMX|nr:cyclic AMP-dependent transcription factor ATF-6 alpha isoform X2 [Scophthalmus maximus]AWP11020.1 putative cyclic AMP-dependent transcription factor ATF-6 alpha [Scophthalmus maximus]
MSSALTLDFDNRQLNAAMESEAGVISIDQGGEWDISLFDELDNLGDADELFQALENAGYATADPVLDFDIDILWNEVDTSSTCTDGEVSVDSLSPAHTLSSVPSPASLEALSPYSLHDEALSPQRSPVSVCSESSGFSEISPLVKTAPKRTSQTTRAKPAQSVKRPIQIGPKVSIQPKPLITAVPLAQASAPLQTKTIIIQPLQTTVLPMVKPAAVNIQPAPPPGRPIVLSRPSQVLQIHTPQAVTSNVVAMSTLSQDRPVPVTAPPLVSVTLRTPSSDDDSKLSQRQQRMIKNRESASLSRKKKKEYLLTLEARLKLALSENEALKCENGNLKRQLEGLLSENTVLNTTASKRRAVCLMVVVVFLMLNVGPMSVFQGGPGSKLEVVSGEHSGRHLLGFSPEAETNVVMGPEALGSGPSEMADSSEDKALMVVKDPVFLRPPPPCQPPLNRTKCKELAHELRGWVHRHEVQQTKSRRMSNSNHKPTRTILKTENKENAQILTVQYTETTEEKNPGSELQVYYAPHHTYSDFFDELNRRGDTFYVVSFRRDHLLLPATNHNKGSRPKMSLVLPAMNINDSIIGDKEFEVMMQIDCEVTDTRILHIRSSTIPPLLRVNRTDTFYQHSPTSNQATPPVGVLMGSA